MGLLLNQLSFQAGPLTASLPAITVVNPLLAVLLGVIVYDENLRHTPWAITTEAGFLVLFTAAAFALTSHRRRTATTRPSARPPEITAKNASTVSLPCPPCCALPMQQTLTWLYQRGVAVAL